MKKYIFLYLTLMCTQLLAQKNVNTQHLSTSIYGEIGVGHEKVGYPLTAFKLDVYALNIESRLTLKPHHQVGLKMGVSVFNAERGILDNVRLKSIPVFALYSWRPSLDRNYFWDFGIGATYSWAKEEMWSPRLFDTVRKTEKISALNPAYILGYRYQRPNGTLLRLSLSTLRNGNNGFVIVPGISLGYTF